jgi:hypothetical protein
MYQPYLITLFHMQLYETLSRFHILICGKQTQAYHSKCILFDCTFAIAY